MGFYRFFEGLFMNPRNNLGLAITYKFILGTKHGQLDNFKRRKQGRPEPVRLGGCKP